MKQNLKYTRSLAPAGFGGAFFTRAHFQKIAQISSLCDFHYISEGIPSLMHFWLLMTYVLRIWFMQIFVRSKKRTVILILADLDLRNICFHDRAVFGLSKDFLLL